MGKPKYRFSMKQIGTALIVPAAILSVIGVAFLISFFSYKGTPLTTSAEIIDSAEPVNNIGTLKTITIAFFDNSGTKHMLKLPLASSSTSIDPTSKQINISYYPYDPENAWASGTSNANNAKTTTLILALLFIIVGFGYISLYFINNHKRIMKT
jgi:hypothetical protein